MKVTTVLKGIISFVAAAFLILQLLMVGSAALIRPSYQENWVLLPGGPPPPGASTDFNITNQGLFAIQGFTIHVEVYNGTGTYLEGSAGPTTINQFTTTTITVDLYIDPPGGIIVDGDYTIRAMITGYFLWSLITFTFTINQTSTLTFPFP
jgi:hypothetical protein